MPLFAQRRGVKSNFIGITRALALSGVTDFSFVDEEAKWRGSEIHRIIELAAKGTLERKSVPVELKGYLEAHDSFIRETGFVGVKIEQNVECKTLGIRGRIDRAGIMKGKSAIVEFKSGAIQPAVALQLCLGGHLLDSANWWHRYAVQLKVDGSYTVKHFPLLEWSADLATAFACCRVAKWRMQKGLV